MQELSETRQSHAETRQSQKQDNMVQLTTEQTVFVLTNFIRMQNVREVQDAFRLRFPDRNPPLRNTIVDNVRKYQNDLVFLPSHYVNAFTSLQYVIVALNSKGFSIFKHTVHKNLIIIIIP